MSWSIEEHIGECRPWPTQVVVYRGETDECLAYVSGEVADQLKAENEKLRKFCQRVCRRILSELRWKLWNGDINGDCIRTDVERIERQMRELGIEVPS